MSKAVAIAFRPLASVAASKPRAARSRGLMAGAACERAVADRMGHDARRWRPRRSPGCAARAGTVLVDDLEVAAARQLLELHQGEVGLDAGGVAIHHQADRAGRSDHRDLGVAVAVPSRPVPGRGPRRAWRPSARALSAQLAASSGDRRDATGPHSRRFAVGGAAMVAHDPQHGLAVGGEAGEGAQRARHLGRGGVGGAGHDRG